jgi:hypothetical protein
MDTRNWDSLIAELEAVSERLGICGEANLTQITILLRRRELVVRELTALLDRSNFPPSAAEPLRLALAGGVVLERKLRAAADDCRTQLRDLHRDAVLAQALQFAQPHAPQEIDCHG